MAVELVERDGQVIALKVDGTTIVRLGDGDALIESDDMTALITTTAKSKGEVIGESEYTVVLEIPADRKDQLELLELAASQAKVRCKNATRAPGGGLTADEKKLFKALKAQDSDAFKKLLEEAAEEVDEQA